MSSGISTTGVALEQTRYLFSKLVSSEFDLQEISLWIDF